MILPPPSPSTSWSFFTRLCRRLCHQPGEQEDRIPAVRGGNAIIVIVDNRTIQTPDAETGEVPQRSQTGRRLLDCWNVLLGPSISSRAIG